MSKRLPWRTPATPSRPESGERPLDGLTLGVEDLGLEHDVDDDAGHGRSWESMVTDRRGEVAQPYRRRPLPAVARGQPTVRPRLGNGAAHHRTVLHKRRSTASAAGRDLGQALPRRAASSEITTLGRRSATVVWTPTLRRTSRRQWRQTPLLAVHEARPIPRSRGWVTGSNAGQAATPGGVQRPVADPEARSIEVSAGAVRRAHGGGVRPAVCPARRDLVGLRDLRAERRPRHPRLPGDPPSLNGRWCTASDAAAGARATAQTRWRVNEMAGGPARPTRRR